jgi:hypothetical protein
MSRVCRSVLFFAGAALLALVPGCGEKNTPALCVVTGTVTKADGSALTEGLVTFASNEGFSASAPINADGSYAVTSQFGKGLPLGVYKVMITPADQLQVLDGDAPPPRPKKAGAGEVPAKYRDFSTSGWQFEAAKSSQSFDLKLIP